MKPLAALRAVYVRSGLRAALPHGVKDGIRRSWLRVARRIGYPISSPRLPRPDLRRGRTAMKLGHVLVASDLNPRYLESWPLVRRAWPSIAGIEPVLVLVAHEHEAPPELLRDEHVRLFPPIDGIHTAFQAQCIRLLYPALLPVDRAVLISDMELVPIDPWYFHGPLARLDERFFVAYRGDVFLNRGEVSIPYNAARPETWGELFDVASEDAVRARLAEWAGTTEYDGVRGGSGWFTDQKVLYRTLLPWGERTGRLWGLDDDYTGYCRLNRPLLKEEGGLTAERRAELLAGRYTDYNSCIPHGRYRELNDLVVDVALEGLRGRGFARLGGQ